MGYRYLGDGSAYLPGIPAQDLEDDEVPALAKRHDMTPKQFGRHLEESGLYRERGGVGPLKARAKAADDDVPREPKKP